MKKVKVKQNLGAFIDYLGEPTYFNGTHTYKWQCPYCKKLNKDTHKDNLVYSEDKGVIWCFANSEHAPMLLKDMLKNNKIAAQNIEEQSDDNNTVEFCKPKEEMIKNRQDEFWEYMNRCNSALYGNTLYMGYLYRHRGIRKSTVDAIHLGVDIIKRLWTIPTVQYSTENNNIILGFEYRPIDFTNKKGIFREKGTPTGLAMINSYTINTEILVIVEGYFDGYTLWQHLDDKNQSEYYHIVTPSNGVNSLLKYIDQIDFDKYKKYYLFLDNDEAGNTAAEKIMDKYPMFERIKLSCNCKDFNEHYINCLKANADAEF